MLDGLHNIDWSQLIHAYGAASDVPGDIRALMDADEKTFKDALWRLFGNIYHQGTRYTATAPAIPFLVDAALVVAPERGAKIVDLLAAMVEPTAEQTQRDGQTLVEFRAFMAREEADMTADARAECEEFGTGPRVEIEVYDAVLAQIPRLLSALDMTHPAVTVSLLELLGYLPDHLHSAQTLTAKVFADGMAGDVLKVAAIECLASLGEFIDIDPHDAVFTPLMTADHPLYVRTHAAIAMSTPTEAGFAQLLEALHHADVIYALDRHYKRGSGWTIGEVSLALQPWYGTHEQQICDAILHCLPAAQKTGADTSALVATLVKALAHPTPARDYFKDKPAKDLTAQEKRSLESIVTYGTWKVGNNWLGNFKILIASFGLPDRPETLKAYIRSDQSLLSRIFRR